MSFNSFSTQDAERALAIYEEYKALALSRKATAIALQLTLGTKQAASEAKSSPASLRSLDLLVHRCCSICTRQLFSPIQQSALGEQGEQLLGQNLQPYAVSCSGQQAEAIQLYRDMKHKHCSLSTATPSYSHAEQANYFYYSPLPVGHRLKNSSLTLPSPGTGC